MACAESLDPPDGPGDAVGPCEARALVERTSAPVFLPGDAGFPVFRIPAIATTASGAVLVFAEARQSIADPGAGEMALALRRSDDCGATWSEVMIVDANGSGDAHNPAVVAGVDGDGRPTVWLLSNRRPASPGGEFDLPPGLGPDSASLWVRTSQDDGRTWSDAREITADVKDPSWANMSFGPGGAIQTARRDVGRLVVPGWWYRGEGDGGSFVLTSDDFGAGWALAGLPTPGTNEAQVVELSDGRLRLDARSMGALLPGGRVVFTSDDGGASWSAPQAGLPMTPVMSSVVRYGDGLLLQSGPAADGRRDLRVWASEDEGETWGHETVLVEGFAQYSVLTVLDDGTVGMAVEALDEGADGLGFSVRFVRFGLSDLGL